MTDQPTWPTPEQDPSRQVPPPQNFLPVNPAQAPQTSGNAIIALVLAIGSWIVCPIVLAIVALVFASKADREIAASPNLYTGSGLTTAAKIVAWVNIGVAIAVVLIGILVLFVVAVAGGFN
jgi:uncharacterized membrane protein